eukprot:757032-Hanusia_phi.AAC.5
MGMNEVVLIQSVSCLPAMPLTTNLALESLQITLACPRTIKPNQSFDALKMYGAQPLRAQLMLLKSFII